jgi:hypothetical protein
MNRKEAMKTIKQKLQEGKSKKEIFDELSSKVKFKSDLLQYIAMVPSHENRLKYNKINLILFSLLVFVSVVKFIIAFILLSRISIYMLPIALIVPFFSIYFAFMVWNFWGNMYRILGMLGISSILIGISKFESFSSYSSMEIILEISLFYLPAFLIIFLAYYIGIKVFPYYSFWGLLKEEKPNL